MTTITNAFSLAVQWHQAGRLREAEEVYRQILAVEPAHIEALQLLGLAALQSGRYDDAIDFLGRAISSQPARAEAHLNLGDAFMARGNTHDAIVRYRRAIELKPDLAEAWCNLGNALKEIGELDEAAACYRQALQFKPNFGAAHYNLGVALKDQGSLSDATACFRRAVELMPRSAEAHNNLGNALRSQGHSSEAAACFSRAIEIRPGAVELHCNLGLALGDQGRMDDAASCFKRALLLQPSNADAYSELGNVLREQGQHAEAITSIRRALSLRPGFAAAHSNLAHLLLLVGDFKSGWQEYEWRWKTGILTWPNFAQPVWDGGVLSGSILLWTEQGLGDAIQFIRYASLVKRRARRVFVRCPQSLCQLLKKCPAIDQLIGECDKLPEFDVHAPLMSLPRILGTTVDTIPAHTPYIVADSTLINHWRARLADVRGLRIGINWRGREGQGRFRKRDIPLDLLASLAQVSGVRLINLHRGAGRDELRQMANSPAVLDLGDDIDTEAGAFMDTAAIIKNLDLVITSDTAVCHLAGALAAPTWLALPYDPDSRWLLHRKDTPWYPTMRLFRQPRQEDWSSVVEEMRSALAALATH